MDPVAAVVIALFIAAIGGIGLWSTRSSVASWGQPFMRAFGQTIPDRQRSSPSGDDGQADFGAAPLRTHATRPIGEVARSPAAAVIARTDVAAPPAMADVAALFDDRLTRIESRLDALSRVMEQQGEGLRSDWRATAAAAESRQAVQFAEREAQIERLRADTIAAFAAGERHREGVSDPRRAEVSAEVYARLARLESALAAVTNPMLLPGEPYLPAREFLPESLVWENWGDVGERAFALADFLSAQRLHLSQGCRNELGTFITSLRTRLTQEVYPNLQPEPTLMQQNALRAVLDELALELPRIRKTIEREYLDGTRSD